MGNYNILTFEVDLTHTITFLKLAPINTFLWLPDNDDGLLFYAFKYLVIQPIF